MKKYIISSVFAFILITQNVTAQGLYNQGAKIIVQNNANIVLTGSYTNLNQAANNGEIELNGTIYIKGNFVNNASSGGIFINRNTDGDVIFNGAGNSNISGTCADSILFENVTVESSSTITNNHLSSVKGDLTLIGANKNITVGTGDLFVEGQIIGTDYSITAVSTGYLAQNAQTNVQKVFRLTNGSEDLTVAVTILNPASRPIRAKLNTGKNVNTALITTFWDITGENDLNATLVLRLDKILLGANTIPDNYLMRYYNGTRYIPIPQDRVNITDFSTYYQITLTEMNILSTL
ncbi:MAG: hypothetical protein RO257_16575 [Candidatus Kapabacteria bacterium]|nr:hypothetical protein [Candidatus Kapabacteria bacterium]